MNYARRGKGGHTYQGLVTMVDKVVEKVCSIPASESIPFESWNESVALGLIAYFRPIWAHVEPGSFRLFPEASLVLGFFRF